ncbi:hypothetical protein NY10_99 [Carnobacterium antarcticum]|nr:hypothetical protein NY10_99 [Carnobacterium sp. CP1]
MSLETIKKLIWSSNVFFFGTKKIDKSSFFWFYGYFVTLFIAFIFWIVALKII